MSGLLKREFILLGEKRVDILSPGLMVSAGFLNNQEFASLYLKLSRTGRREQHIHRWILVSMFSFTVMGVTCSAEEELHLDLALNTFGVSFLQQYLIYAGHESERTK